ncbi:MAG: MaoC family dehydratase [Betaproteobacteria bacterium]|nr:MAG: MaoC family dehydratase [Betaproteobacteria bacterium]
MVVLPLDSLGDYVGQELAVSDWLTITQDRINQFADATGDHQWIHLDAERAARESPFKNTIAHGFLTLSLIPYFKNLSVSYSGVKMGVNYGTNRVRFMAPVAVNSRLRARFKLLSVEPIAGGAQTVFEVTIEIEGHSKPACVAELVTRAYA